MSFSVITAPAVRAFLIEMKFTDDWQKGKDMIHQIGLDLKIFISGLHITSELAALM